VHVSDSGTGSLIKVVGDKAEYAMNGLYWGAPNGILAQNDGSLVLAAAIAGQLFQVQPDGTQAEIAKGMYQADGIGIVPGGGYLVSSSSGQIHYASPEGVVTTLINTEGPSIAESTSQNDLTVFGDVAIVPNMTRGTVTAHKIKRN
jgi:hypothetical protein